MKEKIVHLVNTFVHLPAAGLDISDRSIKYVQYDSHKAMPIEAFGEISLPEGIIAGGVIVKEEELEHILKKWLKEEGKRMRASFFSVSLPEEKSFLRLIQLPKVKREEIHNAIRWEIEANIPLRQEDIIYDYEIIEPLKNHLNHFDIVLTAFPKALVEAYVRVLKNAGIRLRALELESQAVARASLPVLREPHAKVLIEIGYSRASFIVFAGGAIFFTTTVELGGKAFEENIAKSMRVSMAKAQELKKQVGLNKKEYNGEVFAALAPSIAVLADETRRSIEYYRAHTTHIHGAAEEATEVLLAGGDANLYGLDTYLAGALKIPVRRVNPFAVAGMGKWCGIPPLSKRKSLAFVASIGLALRGM